MAKLIALALIAAGTYGPDQPEIAKGDLIDTPLSQELIDKLVADKVAEVVPEVGESTKPAKAVKRTRVRLLVDSAIGNCNDVVEVDAADVKRLEGENLVDSSKEAVAYALTLEQNKS